jgi:hypothetical protein
MGLGMMTGKQLLADRDIKNPNLNRLGDQAYTGTLPVERFIQQKIGQVSWLAALSYSLHLPKGYSLSGLRRFRAAYSCGAAMASHHLPWLQCNVAAAQPKFRHVFTCVVNLP